MYKNEEDPLKNEGSIVFTTLCIDFSDAQGQLNTEVSGWKSLKSKPIQVFMHVLISCKNEEDPIKNETCKTIGIFFRYSRAANSAVHVWIWLILLLMLQSGFPRYL